MSCIDEAQSIFTIFSDWLNTVQKNINAVVVPINAVERLAMDKKMKKLQVPFLIIQFFSDC